MLNARRRNRDATLFRTPGLLSTYTANVCVITLPSDHEINEPPSPRRSPRSENVVSLVSFVVHLICRRFDDGVRRRPADHLVEIRPGRHHRVHGIFLLDAEVDERRPTVPAGRHDRAFDVAPLIDRSCLNAERFAQLHEIRSSDWRRGVALLVEELLRSEEHTSELQSLRHL